MKNHIFTWYNKYVYILCIYIIYIYIFRCDQDFIRKLPMPISHLRLATGYGCATIFWFLKNCPEFLTEFDCCGTIMDFVVAMITDNNDEKPVMSVHNAASWGYFDTVSNKVIKSNVNYAKKLL